MPEGPMTWLARLMFKAAELTSPGEFRTKQIAQYKHPELDILPLTEERPTSLTRFKGQAFRSLKRYYPDRIGVGAVVDLSTGDLPKVLNSDDVLFASDSGAGYGASLTYGLGLGHARVSVGKDKRGYYLSVFDSWDFEEGRGHTSIPMRSSDARKIGQPYNIYDRFYFTPDERDGKLYVPGIIQVR